MARWNGFWGTTGAAALLLCVGTSQAIATPPAGDVGTPDDAYYIPDGFFAPGIPAAGTVDQQMAMALAVNDMWALGAMMVDDLAMVGQTAVDEVDALIASGATPFEVYEAAIDREEMLGERAQENVDIVVGGIQTFFVPIEDDGAPTELLTAAFGPTLTSIAQVRAEGDHWIMQLESRRPSSRPSPPAAGASGPPAVVAAHAAVHATPEPSTPSTATPWGSQPAPSSFQQQVTTPQPAYVSPQERKRIERAERKAERARQKAEKKAERARIKAAKKADRARVKAERAEQRRLKKLERQRQKEQQRMERALRRMGNK